MESLARRRGREPSEQASRRAAAGGDANGSLRPRLPDARTPASTQRAAAITANGDERHGSRVAQWGAGGHGSERRSLGIVHRDVSPATC
jgi:hypothetical protein